VEEEESSEESSASEADGGRARTGQEQMDPV